MSETPDLEALDPTILAALVEQANARKSAAIPAAPKAPIPRRLLPRKVVTVHFSLPDWDGEFELPSRKFLTQAEQRGIVTNDEKVMRKVFGDDVFDVVMDMTDDEVMAFVEAWNDASGVTSGESGAA